MGKIVVELTNRCNLSCQHCFSGRHGGKDDLPLEILQNILDEAKPLGFDRLSFTGGDPTVHRQFIEVVRRTCEAGYKFGMVTNGWNFTQIWNELRAFRSQLEVITFSVDGATESSHDRVRGKGSFRRVMSALSLCMVQKIPCTINMVITRENRDELDAMEGIASRLAVEALRFGHLMPTQHTAPDRLDLSPDERKVVEAQIVNLRRKSAIPVAMAPGFHSTDLFPCGPLQMIELNVDCKGQLTKCCHLSGHDPGVDSSDVIGGLAELGFAEALRRQKEENEAFHRNKTTRLESGELQDTDFFACWYCSLHYGKVRWLAGVGNHSWGRLIT